MKLYYNTNIIGEAVRYVPYDSSFPSSMVSLKGILRTEKYNNQKKLKKLKKKEKKRKRKGKKNSKKISQKASTCN